MASALIAICTLFLDKVLPQARRTVEDATALQRIADAVRMEWRKELAARFVPTERDGP
jgi:hypothetical protein